MPGTEQGTFYMPSMYFTYMLGNNSLYATYIYNKVNHVFRFHFKYLFWIPAELRKLKRVPLPSNRAKWTGTDRYLCQNCLELRKQMSEFIMINNACLCCYKYKYVSSVSALAIHNLANVFPITLGATQSRRCSSYTPNTSISKDCTISWPIV